MVTNAKRISGLTLAPLAAVLAALLYGCGGGSSGGANTSPPQPMPGSLDTSFGSAGTVVTPMELGGQALAIALQADGKIVAAGVASGAFALVRYAVDGTLDPAFGTGGKVTSSSFISSPYAEADGVTLQPDGKLVVVGYSRQGNLDVCTLVRLNPDGSPDVGFGHGGAITSNVPVAATDHSRCNAPVVLANGNIVVGVATSGFSAPPGFPGESSPPYGHLGLMRFSAAGALDSTFGVGGAAVFQTPNIEAWASSVAVQPDGRIVVGGRSTSPSFILPEASITEFVLARFDAAGGLDPAFGQGGVIRASPDIPPTAVTGLALQPDGRIVVAVGGLEQVLRLLPNGAPDPSFRVGAALQPFWGAGIALQSNGKVIYAGTIPLDAGGQQLALWRLGPDGAPDPGFGNGGSTTTAIGKLSNGYATAIQQDGRIVVVGKAWTSISLRSNPSDMSFAVVRYFGDPVTTTSP